MEMESVETKLSNESLYWKAKIEELEKICRQLCDPTLLKQAQLNELNTTGHQRLDYVVNMFTSNIAGLTTKAQQLQTVSNLLWVQFFFSVEFRKMLA